MSSPDSTNQAPVNRLSKSRADLSEAVAEIAHSAEASCQRPAVAYEASIVIVTHEATTTPASADSQVRCRDRGESPRYWWPASSRETDNRCHQQINWAYRCHLTQKRAVDLAEFDCTMPVKMKNINFTFQQRPAGPQCYSYLAL